MEGAGESVLLKKYLLILKALDILVCLSNCFICFNAVQAVFYNHWCTGVIFLKFIKTSFVCLECQSCHLKKELLNIFLYSKVWFFVS